MQLILNTENTADIKTKMSLNEDKFEKCVTEIISIVTNGDLANANFSNKNNEAGDIVKGEKNKLMLETLETELITADNELINQVENDVKISHADIEAAKKKDLDQHQTDTETEKHQETNALPNNDKENEISEKNVNNKEQDDEEEDTLLILSDSDLNICDSGDKIVMDACESVVVEEKCPVNANSEDLCESLVVEGKCSEITNSEVACESVVVEKKPENANSEVTEYDDDNKFDKCLSVDNDKVHTDLATFERNTKICGISKSADAILVSVVKEQNETAIDKNATEFCDDNVSEDPSLDLSHEIVDTEPVENKTETEFNDSDDIMEDDVTEDDIIVTMDRNGTVDDISKNNLIDGTAHINKCEDETIPKELTASSNEIISRDEQKITDDDRIIDYPEDKIETNSCKETDEKQDANQIENTENKCDHEVTDKMDISEKSISIDCSNIYSNNGSGDKTQCLHENSKITDPVENKTLTEGVSENLVNSMNVDDEAGKISEKEETEINLRASPVKSPSNLNSSDDRTVTITNSEMVDCSTIEPATAQAKDTATAVSDVSDDVIFSVDDDDKEKSTKLSDVNEVESNEIIVNDDKNDCDVDNGKVTENVIKPVTEVPKPSDDIIDLEETVSKSLESISKTPDLDSGELHKNTTEKISEEFNPLVLSDSTVDLNKVVNPPITSESTSIQNSNERQDDATEIISGVVPPVLKLSNTLDILSDEEEEPKATNMDNKCINIEDDDDIMLIDDDTSGNESKAEQVKEKESEIEKQVEIQVQTPVESMEICKEVEKDELTSVPEEGQASTEIENVAAIQTPEINDKIESKTDSEIKKPLLQEKFLKTCKKNLADMTREELEEFCVLKIVESILDRSNLSEIRTKLKTMSQNIDEYKKKAMMLTKQNRDLQVVLKSIQEDQKKGTDSIVPLKITRSVGMQVLMGDKTVPRRKPAGTPPVNKPRNPVPQGPRPQKPATPQKQSTPQIPVPRLVPANNPTLKSPTAQQTNPGKITSPVPNGIKTPTPAPKGEKRSHNRIQSVTVDLTDDEPPAKMINRAVPVVPPVRLVPSQNLLAPPRQPVVNSSPRKVYIPISGPQGQNVRPGQTIMLKTVPSQGPRQRCPPPHMVRMPQTMRMPRPQGMRHPAPLPDCVKQYQPPNWKALPPAPDLKLAKVENGIVISWKIEGYQEDSYEEIASYQLYAYQETSSPPSTALWKKIGDVKALPLPMACTLTQFMAGYKYYFAVRALDIRSRLGPFSLPGSILLLNKM